MYNTDLALDLVKEIFLVWIRGGSGAYLTTALSFE